MCERIRIMHLPVIGSLLLSLLLSACGLVNRNEQATSTTNPPRQVLDAASLEIVQAELVTFMLDFFQQEICSDTRASIIVLRSVTLFSDATGYQDISMGNLIKAWWYENGQLVEASDPAATIIQYHQEYQESADLSATWGEYEFGILSLSADGQHAEIGFAYSNAIDAAGAIIYTLDRDVQGVWQITGEEQLWIA